MIRRLFFLFWVILIVWIGFCPFASATKLDKLVSEEFKYEVSADSNKVGYFMFRITRKDNNGGLEIKSWCSREVPSELPFFSSATY